MIDQQIISMLDDPNPNVRSDAVKQLAKMKNQEAVQYLAAIYKTDDDPEVRALARKAGLYIKKKMAEEQWTGGDGDPDEYEKEPEPVAKVYNVKPRDVEAAKGHMEMALNLHMSGDDIKAAQYVERAFTTNPNLKDDMYYLSMASSIMNISSEQVVEQFLGDDDGVGNNSKRKNKRKSKNNDPDDVTTGAVITDLLIYLVVVAGLVIVGILILITILSSALQTAMADPEFIAMMNSEGIETVSTQEIVQLTNSVVQGGFVFSIAIGLAAGVISVIGLLLQLGCYHVVATMLLGGEGTFKKLIHKVTMVLTGFTIAYVILGVLMLYVGVNGILTGDPTVENQINAINALMSLGNLGYLIWLVMTLGKVYNFGTGSGCATIIIGGILLGILAVIMMVPVITSIISSIPTNI